MISKLAVPSILTCIRLTQFSKAESSSRVTEPGIVIDVNAVAFPKACPRIVLTPDGKLTFVKLWQDWNAVLLNVLNTPLNEMLVMPENANGHVLKVVNVDGNTNDFNEVQ